MLGGPGSEDLRVVWGGALFRGGGGEDALVGGRDLIRAADGDHDLIRCGPGTDRAFVDRSGDTTGCERVVLGWPG